MIWGENPLFSETLNESKNIKFRRSFFSTNKMRTQPVDKHHPTPLLRRFGNPGKNAVFGGSFETFLVVVSCTPWKINMEHTAITHLERKMIFQTPRIMFHVNLPGCRCFFQSVGSHWISSQDISFLEWEDVCEDFTVPGRIPVATRITTLLGIHIDLHFPK